MDLNSIKEKRKGAYRGCRKIGDYIRDCRNKPKE